MKKGFTLIELLAVIVVLTVIALIATPIVLNVIEHAKEKANMNSAYGFIDAGRLYFADSLFNDEKAQNIKETNNIWEEIKVNGNKPKTGELYVNTSGSIALAVIIDHVCYQKKFVGEIIKLKEDECSLGYLGNDKTAPTVSFHLLNSSLNEQEWSKEDLSIEVSISDQESGVNSYQWCTTTETCVPDVKVEKERGTVIISNESTTNRVCVIGLDNNGNKSDAICSEPYKIDKTAPNIEGIFDLKIVVGDPVDLNTGVRVRDDLSGVVGSYSYEPTVVNTNVDGKVDVTYKAIDQAGNEVEFVRVVEILAETQAKYFTFNASTKTITAYNNTGPKEVVIPKKINGVVVEQIGEKAFQSKSLTNVIIPSTVVRISSYAFNLNVLSKIVIPTKTTYIGTNAFSNNLLSSIVLPNSVITIEPYAFSFNRLTAVILPDQLKTIGEFCFYSNRITDITIPSSVIKIGDDAFYSNLLNTVKIIGKSSAKGFTTYGNSIWGWASGFTDSNVIWNASA